MKPILLALTLALACSWPAWSKPTRSQTAVRAFKLQNPCPSTGKPRGKCPGYVVDHVVPLCDGGEDAPRNMQWQTRSQAVLKDRAERQKCRKDRAR